MLSQPGVNVNFRSLSDVPEDVSTLYVGAFGPGTVMLRVTAVPSGELVRVLAPRSSVTAKSIGSFEVNTDWSVGFAQLAVTVAYAGALARSTPPTATATGSSAAFLTTTSWRSSARPRALLRRTAVRRGVPYIVTNRDRVDPFRAVGRRGAPGGSVLVVRAVDSDNAPRTGRLRPSQAGISVARPFSLVARRCGCGATGRATPSAAGASPRG